MPPSDWPDIEALLRDRLTPALVARLDPDGTRQLGAATDTPTLEGRWFLKLTLVTGSDDGVTETSRVDLETFAPTRGDAHDFGLAAREELHALAGTARPDGSGLIDTVTTTQRPVWVTYNNPAIHRFVGSYSVAVRRQ